MFNEVQNSGVTKLRYETKLRKMTSQVKKKQHRVTNSIVKLFWFHFRVIFNSKLKNKRLHF